jgi:arylsulfatase A-like enzyme
MDPQSFPGQRIDPEAARLFGDLIPAYYEYVDSLLGELVAAAAPETTVIVFSDHGFGPTGNLPWSGGHGRITPGAPIAPDGILVLSGPPIRPGAPIDAAHVLDLTPTLLYLQGLPTAADMPGRILVDAFRGSALAESGPRRVVTYETTPRERVAEEILADPELDRPTLEKLRALGYVD